MVYLLRFSHPLGSNRHQAQYYLGYCDDERLADRLAEHQAGRGAAITRAAIARGHTLEVVRTWPGARRDDERRMKRAKNHARLLRGYFQSKTGVDGDG